jgi:hypothetical protein
MSMDAEWEVWRREWQSETAVRLDLRKIVERQSRWMRIALIADVLVTLAAMTWLFVAAAWTFALNANRGNWSPSALDTAAFVDLSVRRCRSRLAAVWFGAGLYVSEIAFCLGWIYRHSPEPRTPLWAWLFFGSLTIDVVWAATLAFAGALIWYRRRKRAEIAWLLGLRGQAAEPVDRRTP